MAKSTLRKRVGGRKPKDLTGQRFGLLEGIRLFCRDRHGNAHWLFRCDCQSQKIIHLGNVTSGHTTSCGCLRREALRVSKTKHGMARSRLDVILNAMLARCHNPNHENYRYYGARGITVCVAWRRNRSAFFGWALANGYQDGLQIDTKNKHRGYAPGNCRWATRRQQQRNKTNNRRIRFMRQVKAVAEWAEISGIPRSAIGRRLDRGWSVRETPVAPPLGTDKIAASQERVRKRA